MDYKIMPLFKSHYSLGRGILTLEEPKDKSGKPRENSIFHLAVTNHLDTVVLVDDNVSGLLQASHVADGLKLKLIFGLRLDVNDDLMVKDDASWLRRAKYIVFGRNPKAYEPLTQIWSKAAKDGFYYTPCMDFKTLKAMWTEDLTLAVPFYDSFLDRNLLYGYNHVPDIEWAKPIFLTEDNDLPFDDILWTRVMTLAQHGSKYTVFPAQSIYYKSPEDFEAYMTFRCIHNRGSNAKSTLEKPDLEHMSSDCFNFDRWLKRNSKV